MVYQGIGNEMKKQWIFFFIASLLAFNLQASLFEANVQMVNFPQEQEKKIIVAIQLIKKVVTSDEFKERIISHVINGKKTFMDNNGFTNEEIYQKIIEGAEVLKPDKNKSMDVVLELYNQANNTIGYTYPHTSRIWINSKFFNTYSPVQVADNLFHEWMHKLGFDHEIKYSKNRNYSVPYAIGYLVEELARKHYLTD